MASVRKRLLIWTLICGVSAGPSFFVAASIFGNLPNIIAMLLGIAIFIAGYTWLTGTAWFARLRRHRYMRRAMLTGFTTRIAISIAYPVGLFLDVCCGMLSGSCMELLMLPEDHVVRVFLTTLLQGAILNFVLGVFILVICGLQRLFCGPVPLPGAFCEECRYDLRATTGVCPECGTPVGCRRAA